MNSMILDKENINRLLLKGKALLANQRYEEGLVGPYPVVDDANYSSWRSQVLHYIQSALTENNQYYKGLRQELQLGAYPVHVLGALAHLEALLEDLDSGL